MGSILVFYACEPVALHATPPKYTLCSACFCRVSKSFPLSVSTLSTQFPLHPVLLAVCRKDPSEFLFIYF